MRFSSCASTSRTFLSSSRRRARPRSRAFSKRRGRRRPSLKAVAVSTVDDPGAIRATLQSGAWAYVLKDAHPQDIAVAVRQALSHSIYLAHTVDPGETANTTAAPQSNGSGLSVLTRREREILALVTEGKSNSAMARELWVTEQTVKFHLSNIYRKLGVANRTAASRWAHEHGIETAAASPRRPDTRLAERLRSFCRTPGLLKAVVRMRAGSAGSFAECRCAPRRNAERTAEPPTSGGVLRR